MKGEAVKMMALAKVLRGKRVPVKGQREPDADERGGGSDWDSDDEVKGVVR